MFGFAKDSIITAAIGNPATLGMINVKISRYGKVTGIKKDSEGYHADFQLNGIETTFKILLKEIIISDDGLSVRLQGFESQTPFIANLLEDFVEGKSFRLPKNEIVQKLVTLLK